MSILSKAVFGYDELEPGIITAMALKRNIFIEGLHGTGKSTLGRCLGMAADMSGKKFRYYPCDKTDIANLAGVINVEEMAKNGMMTFSKHNRSIFGAKVIVADELPRANKDRANLWLEILQEKTLFGESLDYDIVISCGNPATYKGSGIMDDALKSRFLFFMRTDLSNPTANDVQKMIRLNASARDFAGIGEALSKILSETREKYQLSLADSSLAEQVGMFISNYINFVLSKTPKEDMTTVPCPREYADQLFHGILGLKAYYEIVGAQEPLVSAAKFAINNTIENKHSTNGPKFLENSSMAFNQLKRILSQTNTGPKSILEWKFAVAYTTRQRVEFWRENSHEITQHFDNSEIAHLAGETLSKIGPNEFQYAAQLKVAVGNNPKIKHIAQEIDGQIATEVIRRFNEMGRGNSSQRVIFNEMNARPIWSSQDVEKILS